MSQTRAESVATVLIVDDEEWTSRSLESILRPRGIAVAMAYTARQALELASRAAPDLCIVDFHLPDMDGVDLVRELRSRRILDPVTPILMSSSGAGRAERLEALGAGAWDILRHPLDPGELIIRLENLIQAKREADRLYRELMTDPGTGLYNVRGILRRAREMGSGSIRYGHSMTCIAVGPARSPDASDADADGADRAAARDFVPVAAHAVHAAVREYDAVGQTGPLEFVIVASGLDRPGAVRLADRILESLERTPSPDPVRPTEEPLPLRAGVYVTAPEQLVAPEHLLSGATAALRQAQSASGGFKVRTFDA